MATPAPLQIKYSIVNTYPDTAQRSWVGAQTTANKRGWWPQVGYGNSGQVKCVFIYAGVLYVTGTFTQMNGVARKGTAAFNIYTGALLPWTVDLGTTVDGRAICAGAAGVFIGGAFTNAGSNSICKYLIKVNLATAAGTAVIDTTWITAAAKCPNNPVECLRLMTKPGGTAGTYNALIVGGQFTAGNPNFPYSKVAVLDLVDGSIFYGGSGSTINGNVLAIELDATEGRDASTGRIFLGGTFTTVNGGTARNRIFSTLTNSLSFAPDSWDPNLDSTCYVVKRDATGLIYLGGDFANVNGATAKAMLCQVEPAGGVATAWAATLTNLGSSAVKALAFYEDVLFVGGSISGMAAALKQSDGSSLGWPIKYTGAPTVNSFAIYDRTIYVGGDFAGAVGSATQTLLAAAPWPYMDDTNAISVSKTGVDTAAGTAAAPVLTIAQAVTMVTSTFKYIRVLDSGIYNEDLDLAATTQIFSADGQYPTLTRYPGAEIGTYGARTSGRKKFYAGAATRYVAKWGNNSTAAANDPTKPYLTIQAAVTACSDGDGVSITDSEVYYETLSVTHSITIQAADGQLPIVNNMGVSAHTLDVIANKTATLYGLTLIGPSFYSGSTYNCINVEDGGGANMYDCTVSGGFYNLLSNVNYQHGDFRNNIFMKAWGAGNVQLEISPGIGAGTSYFVNNYFSSDSAAIGISGVNSLVFQSNYNKVIRNNTMVRAPKGSEAPTLLAAGIYSGVSDTNDNTCVIESNYVIGAGCGINLLNGMAGTAAVSLTVKNNYVTQCDAGYVIWNPVSSHSGGALSLTVANNVGYKNGKAVPDERKSSYGDFIFFLQGTHTMVVTENESIGSYTNGFYFQFNPVALAGTPTILFRRNVAMGAAFNGMVHTGFDYMDSVSGAVPGAAPFYLTPTPTHSAKFISYITQDAFGAYSAFLYADRGSAGSTPMHLNDMTRPIEYFGIDNAGSFFFDATATGKTVFMRFHTDYQYGVISNTSKYEGNVFVNNKLSALRSSFMKTAVGANLYYNYFNDNGASAVIGPYVSAFVDAGQVGFGGPAQGFFAVPSDLSADGQEAFREVQFVSDVAGNEILGLLPDSPGRLSTFNQNAAPSSDVGMNNHLLRFAADRCHLDGFIVSGYRNLWGGVRLASGFKDFQISYCTVTGCAFDAVRHLGSSNTLRPWMRHCDVASNDNGAFDFNVGNAAKYSTFRDNSGAGIYVYLGGARLTNLAAFGNGTGIYESIFSTPSAISKVALSQNGLADAFGSSTYSSSIVCVPDGVIVDTNSLQTNPLFKNPQAGDLRPMALADGDQFDSPALALGAVAFRYDYGAAVTTYTLVDFGTSGWWNPDKAKFAIMPIKLTEGVKSGGGSYSNALYYKLQRTYAWGPQNPMPDAQVLAVLAMFKASDPNVSLSEDGGSTWLPLVLIKSKAPSFQSIAGGDYIQDSATMPRPIDALVFREA